MAWTKKPPLLQNKIFFEACGIFASHMNVFPAFTTKVGGGGIFPSPRIRLCISISIICRVVSYDIDTGIQLHNLSITAMMSQLLSLSQVIASLSKMFENIFSSVFVVLCAQHVTIV